MCLYCVRQLDSLIAGGSHVLQPILMARLGLHFASEGSLGRLQGEAEVAEWRDMSVSG